MIETIQRVPNWHTLTAAQITEALNVKNIEIRDDQQYTWAGIALLCGPVVAETLRLALENNSMTWAVHQFGGTGMSITNPLVRGAIEQFILADIDLQPLLDATIYYKSIAEQYLGEAVTEEQVQAALDTFRFEARLTNSLALFVERMTPESDASAIMAQAWEDAGT